MSFSKKDFITKTLVQNIGKLPSHKIRLRLLDQVDNGTLTWKEVEKIDNEICKYENSIRKVSDIKEYYGTIRKVGE